MNNGTVNLVFNCVKRGNGAAEVARDARDIRKEMDRLFRDTDKLGQSFGNVGGIFGRAVKSLVGGSIFGIAAEGVRLLITLWEKHKETVRKAAEEERKAWDDNLKAAQDYAATLAKSHAEANAAIDAGLKRLNDEIDATKELTKATLELAKEKARAAGDSTAVAAIGEQMKAVDQAAAAEKMDAAFDAAIRKTAEAEKNVAAMRENFEKLSRVQEVAEKKLAVEEARIRKEAETTAHSSYISGGMFGGYSTGGVSEAERKRQGDLAVETFRNSDAYKDLKGRVDAARKAADAAMIASADAQDALVSAEANQENVAKRVEAAAVAADVAEVKAANDAQDAERKKADAAVEAAKKEHAERMKNIREEMAERQKFEDANRTKAAAAFEREFALYRDPAARDRKFDEEEARKADIQRMLADVRKSNSSLKVQEIARMMREGDDQGVEARFESWRKDGYFKGMDREREQLIRTAAAYENRNQSEKALAEIAKNTEDLAVKLDELLQVKGGN